MFVLKKLSLIILVITNITVVLAQENTSALEEKIVLAPKQEQAHLFLQLGKAYAKQNKAAIAFENLQKAKKSYEQRQDVDSVMYCNLAIFKLLDGQDNLGISNYLHYLKKYADYAKQQNNTKNLLEANKQFASYYFDSINYSKAKNHYQKALIQAKKLNDRLNQAKIYTNLGLLYSGFIRQDSARAYFDKALKLYKTEDKVAIFATYLNYANTYQKEKNYSKAILYLKKAEKVTIKTYKNKLYKILYKKLADCYQKKGAYEESLLYYNKYEKLNKKLNNTKQNIAISEIKEKYDNEKLRGDKLELEAKRLQNRNYLIATLSLLLLGSILSFFIFKNSKKKRLLAEKDKEIEHQKVTSLLKEQELIGINAMVTGQEKERKRIAEDLHDDIGSALTTLKLHLENFKYNKEKDAFSEEKMLQDTGKLLDETYLKVRSMAHAKNSGVLANQGLLIAVQNMANKIASANKLSIEVIDFGLDKRIDNTLELTSFRIIQELITNIIKHAQATTASIQLNLFDDMLNIIIEDNGVGFDINTIKLKQGMGLQSIKTRIEHLEGSFEIDSKKGKGSTFIINLPI